MFYFNPSTSIMTLNVNGLNIHLKRKKLTGWILKSKTLLYAVYKELTLNIKT